MSLKRDFECTKFKNYSSGPGSDKKYSSYDVVYFLIRALETADYQLRVDIENDLVKIGKKAVYALVEALNSSHEKVRSHVAMALIRIGADCIEPLNNKFKNNPEYHWVVDFIASEINEPNKIITANNYYESMAS